MDWSRHRHRKHAPRTSWRGSGSATRLRANPIPALVMISSCNMGQTGPRADTPGFGSQLSALAGFCGLTGDPNGPPMLLYGPYIDFIASTLGAAAVLAALDRQRTHGDRRVHRRFAIRDAGCCSLPHRCSTSIRAVRSPSAPATSIRSPPRMTPTRAGRADGSRCRAGRTSSSSGLPAPSNAPSWRRGRALHRWRRGARGPPSSMRSSPRGRRRATRTRRPRCCRRVASTRIA